MSETMEIDETRVAYHEAGHAAADLLLDHTPHHVTIIPHRDALGSAGQLDGDVLTEAGIEDLVVSLFAGAAAEKRISDDHESVMLGASSDYEKADRYLEMLSSSKAELEQRTEELIHQHWRLVERIAAELIEYGTLGEDELDCLLNIYRGDEPEDDLAEYRARASAMGEFKWLRGRRK